MRAMILIVLLLALLALFSFYEPLAPYWKSRFSAVMMCLDEGRYDDAWEAATAGTPPGEDSPYWERSEPLGEAGPVAQSAPGDDIAPAEEAGSEAEPSPVNTAQPAEQATSGM